jgi:4-amino-4-deoxy-L-arabinose transferase-like glycosyltransferase
MRRTLLFLPIGAVLTIAAVLRLWNLGQNGFSREYYAAAVRGMLQSWHNTFFNSFDPGGFVSLDKPPFGIWVQALFAKLFGFSALHTLLPQVILGLLAVLLLYLIVRRSFGERAAVIAAVVLALAPGNIAVDRTNNLESCLVVILLIATYLAIRAAETGRLLYLAGAMLMMGIGFNVKMAAALLFAPAIAIVFFLFNRQHSLSRHVTYQAVAGTLLIAMALSWLVAFDLTSADKRPYAGSTKNNSMLELALKHNGTDRFKSSNTAPAAELAQPEMELYDTSPAGPLRLFSAIQAGQFAWLLPIALAGIVLGLRAQTRERRIAVSLWIGWLASYWIVYSAAGGPFHTYYLAALSPPLAALAGVGAAELLNRYRDDGERAPILLLIAITASWQAWLFYGQTGINAPVWLVTLAGAALVLAASSISVTLRWPQQPALLFVPLAALLVLPVAAALSVVLIRPNVIAPVATLAAYQISHAEDATRANTARRDAATARLIAFLHQEHRQEKILVAVENAFAASPIIIATGQPVMTMGGYLGTDPILTPEKLREMAGRGVVRFVLIGGLSFTKRNTPAEIALREWVTKNGKRVEPALWSINPLAAGKPYRVRLGGAWVELIAPDLFDIRADISR